MTDVERMIAMLRQSPLFAYPTLAAMTRASDHFGLWSMLNDCLRDFRIPLYARRLGKRPAKPQAIEAAIQRGLTLLGAYVTTLDLPSVQAVISSHNGWVTSISFQPRPQGLNWTAMYAIDPPDAAMHDGSEHAYVVTVEDILHLAAKLVHLIAGYAAGELPDVTATFVFGCGDCYKIADVDVVVREHRGAVHRACLAG